MWVIIWVNFKHPTIRESNKVYQKQAHYKWRSKRHTSEAVCLRNQEVKKHFGSDRSQLAGWRHKVKIGQRRGKLNKLRSLLKRERGTEKENRVSWKYSSEIRDWIGLKWAVKDSETQREAEGKGMEIGTVQWREEKEGVRASFIANSLRVPQWGSRSAEAKVPRCAE